MCFNFKKNPEIFNTIINFIKSYLTKIMEGIMSNNNNKQDLKGKAKIACKKLEEINNEKESISEELEEISKNLKKIIKEEKEINKVFNRDRTKVEVTPKRIWFSENGVEIYIDFTVFIEKGNIQDDVFGAIVYGTCIFNEQEKVEDKPLIKLTLGSNGIISSGDEFANESWINDEKGIIDLHYRTVEYILKDVYYWTNKYILP